MRLVIFGGTFNPIHLAHVRVAESAFRELRFDRLLLVPAAEPPHKVSTGLAPAVHRLRMAELAAEGREDWQVSDVEIRRGGRSYAIDTVRTVTEEYGLDEPPFWLIGADMLQELDAWRDIGQLSRLCRFAVVARPGSTLDPPAALVRAIGQAGVDAIRERIVPAPAIDVASTTIRALAAEGKPIDDLVPAAVAAYIREHGLYSR